MNRLFICCVLFWLIALIEPARAQSDLDRWRPFDPFNIESRIGLDFDSYYFVASNSFYSIRPGFYYGVPNNRHMMGLSIPVVHSIFSGNFAGFENTTGIGDIKLSYVGVPYQSNDLLGLLRVAAFLDATAPTGNDQLGRGVGAWVLKPGFVLTYRPDPAFFVFPQVMFQFSTSELNGFGAGDGLPDLEDPDAEKQLRIVSVNLPATLALESWEGWFTLSADYMHSFSEDNTYFLFLRMELGKMLGKKTSAVLSASRFIAGQPRLETSFRVKFNFFLESQRN